MIEQDIANIDFLIIHDMQTNAEYLRQVAVYFTEHQEPRLHLDILLLSLKMINYQGQSHLQTGVILEYVFSATQLHNDTMEQKIRCQDEVLNQGLKGTNSRILVGDFFYSRAFYLMSKLGELKVVSHLCNAINQYIEGQIQQIFHTDDSIALEQMYFQGLKRKSCLYYTSVTQVVGVLGNCTKADNQALCDYGLHLGMAVQTIEETLCCIRGNEAGQHKQFNLSFVMIRGLQQATPALRQLIYAVIAKQPVSAHSVESAKLIRQVCIQTDALAYTRAQIEVQIKRARQAIVVFPESIYRLALQNIATKLLVQFDQDLAKVGL
jgi:octaprenyl-diphosphate synthase